MEALEAAPPAGPAFNAEESHGEADDFAPPGLLIKPSQPLPKQPLGEPGNFAQQVEDVITAFLRTKPNNTEHLSKIGVLLRQRRLLPEGKLKFFLDTRCPRLVVDGEPAGSQYVSLATTTTTREGQQGGHAAGEGAQQAQQAGSAGSRPASAPAPQRPTRMDRPQSAVSAGPIDPDDIDEDWLESVLVNHMRSQPSGAVTGPTLGDFCIKQLGFSMRGRLTRFLLSRPQVFRMANDGRQTVLLVEQRGQVGNGGAQQGPADRARQPGQQQAQQAQQQAQQGSLPPSLAPLEASSLPGGAPSGPDASNVATSILPGAAAAARETRSFTKWDPLTQEVFQFVRSRGVATFQQIDTHCRNNCKHLISGAGIPPHAWKSQIFLGKRRNIFRLQGPVVSLVSHVPGEEAAAGAPSSAAAGAAGPAGAGGARSSPPDGSPPPLAQPSSAVSAGAASPAPSTAGHSAAGRSSDAAAGAAGSGGAQAGSAVQGHNPVLDAFIAERKAMEELRDDIQHKLASFKALSELQKENAGLRAACVTLGRELLSMKQDFTLFRDQIVQVLGGEGGQLSALPSTAAAPSELAASHAALQRAGSAGNPQQQQQLQPQRSPMQQSQTHQPQQVQQPGQPPLANGSLAASGPLPPPLPAVPAGLGTSPQLQQAQELSATGQGAAAVGHLVSVAPAALPSQEGGILLVGGHDGVSWLDSADFFSPYKGAWSSLPILDQPRSFAVVVATPADIFVAGGGNGMDWYNTVVRCDRYQAFAGGSWQAIAPMNVARGSLAGAISCGRLYCYGGGKPKEQYNVVEWYDPGNDRWFIGPALSSRRFALGGAAIDNALYAVGGYDGETYLSTVERLDPREGRWGVLPGEMASKRGGHACVAAGGCLYALGGFDSLQAIPHCEVFDPRMNAWSPIGDMSDARAYGSAAAVGGEVYALGGLQSDMETHSVLIERYDRASNSWQHVALPSNANPRRSFLAACGLE